MQPERKVSALVKTDHAATQHLVALDPQAFALFVRVVNKLSCPILKYQVSTLEQTHQSSEPVCTRLRLVMLSGCVQAHGRRVHYQHTMRLGLERV
jgi:hypothetical protein